MRRIPGFTLIELLVCISILAVLIGLLLPSLVNSRKVTYTQLCAANLRQVGIGFQYYADENKDYVPSVASGLSWAATLGNQGYFGASEYKPPLITAGTYNTGNYRWKVYKCAGETAAQLVTADGSYNGSPTTNWDNDFVPLSYMINWSTALRGYGVPMKGWSQPKGYTPSVAMIVGDGRRWGYGWDLPYYEWNVDAGSDYGYYQSHAFRHINPNTTANFLFMDGHVAPRLHYNGGLNPANWQQLW